MMWGVALMIVCGAVALLLCAVILCRKRVPDLRGAHVLITGGSSGIGKSLAVAVARRGSNITLVARDINKLEETRNEILQHVKNPLEQKVRCVSLDVCKSYPDVERAIEMSEEESGPIYILANCAGTSMCSRFEDTPPEEFKRMMDINYVGTVYPTKAVVPRMKSRRRGKIIVVASQAALLGIFGYTAYSGSKFALRGLAEALQMEVKPYNISVTVSLPPDTDTPGFAEEEKTKLMETRLISEAGGLMSPDDVATKILKDALEGNFFSTLGLESYVVRTVCAGMSPVSSVLELLVQVFLMGPIRLCGAFILRSFDKIVHKCMNTRDKNKKSE